MGRRHGRAAVAEHRVAGQALDGDPRSADRCGLGRGDHASQRAADRPVLLRREADLDAGGAGPGKGARGRPAGCGSARSTRSCATGSAPGSRPIRRRRRACSSALPAPTDFDPWLCEQFGVPRDVLPRIEDTAGELGALRHPSWDRELPLRARLVDQQAALAGTGCVVPGMVKATYGTGRVRVRARRQERSRRAAACCPRSRGGSMASPSTRSTAGCSPPAHCSSGCRAISGSRRIHRRSRSCAVSRGLRRRASAARDRRHRRALVAAGRARRDRRVDGGQRRPQVARAALEGIAWRVADVFERSRSESRFRRCAWTVG